MGVPLPEMPAAGPSGSYLVSVPPSTEGGVDDASMFLGPTESFADAAIPADLLTGVSEADAHPQSIPVGTVDVGELLARADCMQRLSAVTLRQGLRSAPRFFRRLKLYSAPGTLANFSTVGFLAS